jgi:hypothetical protein
MSKRNNEELERPEKQLTIKVKYKIFKIPTRKTNENSDPRLGCIDCIRE